MRFMLAAFLFLGMNSLEASEISEAFLDKGAPLEAVNLLMEYYNDNESKLSNNQYLSLIDFTQSSSNERFYVLDLQTLEIETYLTAHGRGSDPDHDSYIDEFSNVPQSKMSSIGFYLTAETYFGQHGYSLRLDGLSKTNSLARDRLIVIHGADYVDPSRQIIGRSWGCPALERKHTDKVINQIKGGSLIFAYHENYF